MRYGFVLPLLQARHPPRRSGLPAPLRRGRPAGAYLRILVPGEVRPGDPVSVSHQPAHGLTVAHVAHAYHSDHDLAADFARAPELATDWHTWAAKQLQTRSSRPHRGPRPRRTSR